jgi:hypothetical protein
VEVMAGIYCTKKLLTHFKQPVPTPREVELNGTFEAWYVNVILLGRVKHILCCEAVTNCYVLMPARVIHSKSDVAAQLEQLIGGAATDILARAGFKADQIVGLLGGFRAPKLEYQHNRRILGLMTDATFYLENCWENGLRDLPTLEDELFRRFQSDGKGSYQTPLTATQARLNLLSDSPTSYEWIHRPINTVKS